MTVRVHGYSGCHGLNIASTLHISPRSAPLPSRLSTAEPPQTLMSYTPGTAKVAAVNQQLRDRDAFLEEIRERLLLAQDVMKEHQNKKRRQVDFAIGDCVWLRLQQCTAIGITAASSSKLGPHYFGPY